DACSPTDETPLATSASTVPEIAAEPIAIDQTPVAAREPDAAIALPPTSTAPSPITVLEERRALAARKSRSPLRATGRWAAAITLIAALATLAVTGAGFAALNGVQPAIERACAFGPDICTIVRALPF